MSTTCGMWSFRRLAVLMLICTVSAVSAGEATPGKEAPPPKRVIDFTSPPSESERRDIFYDLSLLMRVQVEIARKAEGALPTKTDIERPAIVGSDGREAAEAFAQGIVDQIRELNNQNKWDAVLKVIDANFAELETVVQKYPKSQNLKSLFENVKNSRHQAEEKKIYEEARQQFLALGLRVEGIIWSGDQKSLALISGEPKALGIDDRVKSCQITNIDTNRVDFMFSYRRRKFHFQRYIGEDF